jgi:hypothetical protein
MSASTMIDKAKGLASAVTMSDKDVATLGCRVLRMVEGCGNHVALLHRTPVTHYDLLADRVRHSLDFAELDALLRELTSICKLHGARTFDLEGEHTLDGARLRLADFIASLAPLREARGP